VGEVLRLDHYGNALTNLGPADAATVGEPWALEVGGLRLAPSTHYGAVAPGAPLVLLGSLGTYEVAVNRGSAADRLGLKRGSRVRLIPLP
jgi:S-adenosylmethionine hydrolase